MADFTIVKPEPFVIQGVDGALYELPRLKDLSAKQVADLGNVPETEDTVERCNAVKSFILSLCPELDGEPLTDMGYLQLFNALAEGSGIGMGES